MSNNDFEPAGPGASKTSDSGEAQKGAKRDDTEKAARRAGKVLDVYAAGGPLRLGIVNQDKDLRTKARVMGENKLAKQLNSQRGIKKILTGIWQGGIARGYYRQKYINEAREQLIREGSLAHDAGVREELRGEQLLQHDRESRRYNRAVTNLFMDDLSSKAGGDERAKLQETNPVYSKIRDIIARYADGSIANEEDADREFRKVISSLGQEFGEGHLSISNIKDVAIAAKKRYEDMKTIVEAECGRFDHDEAMKRVMHGFEIVYGSKQIEKRTPKGNTVDSVIDKLESTAIGSMVPPATLALATATAMSVSEFVGQRLVSTVCAVVPGLSGAILGGVRASSTFEQERSRAFYEERYSRKVENENKRGEKVRKTVYKHHSAREVVNRLADARTAIDKAKSEGKDTSALYENFLRIVAETKYLLECEREGNTVLKYTSERNAPEEQLILLQQYARAKSFLRKSNSHYADVDKRLDNQTDLMKNVINGYLTEQQDKDKAARDLKIKTILKKSGTGLLVGAAFGLAAQEVRASALFDRDNKLQGLFEGKQNVDASAKLTALAKAKQGMLGLFGKKDLSSRLNASFDVSKGIAVSTDAKVSFAKAPDGTYTLFRDGKEVAKGINWNPSNGRMTRASIQALRKQGFEVERIGKLSQTVKQVVPGTTTREVPIGQWRNNANLGVPVRRVGWWDNDTPGVFDFNELGAHYYTDPQTGLHGLVTRMVDSGSFHGGNVSQFSKWVQDGTVKLMISPTSATQGHPIEVLGKVLPNGQIAFVPEEGSIAARFFDASGKFIGKYAEIVQDCGMSQDGLSRLIRPFATVVGRDYSGTLPMIEDTLEEVTKTLSVPEYLISSGITDWVLPMTFPFIYDGAMKDSTPADYVKQRRVRRRPGGGYYDGYGEDYYEDSGIPILRLETDDKPIKDPHGCVKGEVSRNIDQRKQLTLGEEVSEYRKRMVAAGESERASRIDSIVDSSPVLSKMGGTTKTVIMLPVWAKEDYDKIYDTLSLYEQQEGVSLDSFIVCVNVNDRMAESPETVDAAELTESERKYFASHGRPEPTKAEVYQYRYDRTIKEVERARRDFRGLQIATVSQSGHNGIFDVSRETNDVVLFAIDKAIREGRMSADNDVVMVRNDCDVKHISKRYVASIQEAAKRNPKTPIFTGTTQFNINHQRLAPGLGAATQIERMSNLIGAVNGRIHTAGGNFGYRAAHFAAVNGYGFKANGDDMSGGAGSDDLRVGRRLYDAFSSAYEDRGDNSGNPNDRDLMDPSTRMLVRVGDAICDTDNLRYLKFYAGGGFARAGSGVTNDAYRRASNRPEDVTEGSYNENASRGDWRYWSSFYEDIDGPNMEVVAERFAKEMTDYFSCCGRNRRSMRQWERILEWWFGVPKEGVYTLRRVPDTTRRYNGERVLFEFTEHGKQVLRESLRRRIVGNGKPNIPVNNFQRAILEGRWASRASGDGPY